MFHNVKYISKKLADFAETVQLVENAIEDNELKDHPDDKGYDVDTLKYLKDFKGEFLFSYALASFLNDILNNKLYKFGDRFMDN